MNCNNYYTLNKEIHYCISTKEKSLYWKQKYDKFFIDLDKVYLILKDSDNWKRDYIRIKKTFWDNISNDTVLSIISKNRGIPKEIYNLSDLYMLDISTLHLDCIPIELTKLKSLKVLMIDINKIKNIDTLQYFNNLENLVIGHTNVDLKYMKNLQNVRIHSYGNETIFLNLPTFINIITIFGSFAYLIYKYYYK